MPALLDTGSPITVLNAQAAKSACIESLLPPRAKQDNTLTALYNSFQEAQAASRGDLVTIMGVNGDKVNLVKSKELIKVEIPIGEGAALDFGSIQLYVGDLPGLAALNGLGTEAPPAVILGIDVIRQRPSMLLRAQDNEVWFAYRIVQVKKISVIFSVQKAR